MYASRWVMARVRIFCSVARLAGIAARAPPSSSVWAFGGRPGEPPPVPDMENALTGARDPEQLLGFLDGRRDRFLDEDVDPGLQEIAGHGEVGRGRHREAHAIALPAAGAG